MSLLSFALIIVEMLLINGLLLALHRLSPRYGIVPVVAAAAALVAILRFASAVGVFVQVTPDLRFTFGGNVFVPTILMIVLVVYLVEGTIPARLTIGVIIGTELLALIIYNLLALHLRLPGGGSIAGLAVDDPLINPTVRLSASSSLAFLIDLYGIAILFQALINFAPHLSLWVKSGITIIGTLMLNSIVFWALASDSFTEFMTFLPGSMVGGMVSGLLLTPLLALYLSMIAPRSASFHGLERRPTFALLFGTYGQIERRLRHTEDELRKVTAEYRSTVDQERIRAEHLREFVNEIVHDMRSPISGINLRINLVQRSGNPFDRERHLDAIQNQVKQLNRLVDAVVEMARLEREPTSEKQLSDLCAFIHRVFDPCRALGEAKSLIMRVEGCDEVLLVRLDEMTFGRALTNLLENAIRYTPSGSVVMSVERQDHYALIAVRDTGVGIAQEELPRLFDRYFQARSAQVDTAGKGLGLGLAIVKRVVDQHGGRIEVESTPSAGTTFRIWLPIVE